MATRIELADQMRERDAINAEAAFWDYVEVHGNLSELRRLYQKRREDGVSYPTLRKETLTRWKAEYDWDERYAQELEKDAQEQHESFKRMRRGTIEKLNIFSDDAAQKLYEMAMNPEGKIPPRVQLMALDSILDRAGYGKKTSSSEESTASPSPSLPVDASDAEIERLYATLNDK